jgi:methylmalonyl-CoA/ethylmalonyl-CoA epimerase
MVIDHIGVVVQSINDGMRQWQELFGYRQASDVIENTRQKVRVVFLDKSDSIIVKLIEPAAEDSPISAYARRGGGLHHLCFRCDDLNVQIPILRAQGARLIVPPEPGEAFNGRAIAFLIACNNLNVELVDTDEKHTFLRSNQHSGS